MTEDHKPDEGQEVQDAQVLAVQDNNTGLPAMLSPDFDAQKAIKLVGERAEFIQQVRMASLKVLQGKDFVDMDGKPYLQSTGCERLKQMWGIRCLEIKIEPSAKEIRECIENDVPVTVEATGRFYCATTDVEETYIGTRSSDDKFYGGQLKHLGRIDPGHLRKAALSNLEANAITRMLGLRDLDWELVREHTGFDPDKAGERVKYDKKGQKGQQRGRSKGKPPSEKQVNYLKSLAKELLGDAEGSLAVDALREMVGEGWNSKLVSDQIKALKNKNDTDLQAALEWKAQQTEDTEPPRDDGPPPDETTPESQGGLKYGGGQ